MKSIDITLNPNAPTDVIANGSNLHTLRLLIYSLVAAHPDPRSVINNYHALWEAQLEGLSNSSTQTGKLLEAMHAANDRIQQHLDEILSAMT